MLEQKHLQEFLAVRSIWSLALPSEEPERRQD